jgi:hypothetical protein
MSRLSTLIAGIIGIAAVLVVYAAFIAHEFVEAGRAGAAVGVNVLYTTLVQPSFLVVAVTAFGLIVYLVLR